VALRRLRPVHALRRPLLQRQLAGAQVREEGGGQQRVVGGAGGRSRLVGGGGELRAASAAAAAAAAGGRTSGRPQARHTSVRVESTCSSVGVRRASSSAAASASTGRPQRCSR